MLSAISITSRFGIIHLHMFVDNAVQSFSLLHAGAWAINSNWGSKFVWWSRVFVSIWNVARVNV